MSKIIHPGDLDGIEHFRKLWILARDKNIEFPEIALVQCEAILFESWDMLKYHKKLKKDIMADCRIRLEAVKKSGKGNIAVYDFFLRKLA